MQAVSLTVTGFITGFSRRRILRNFSQFSRHYSSRLARSAGVPSECPRKSDDPPAELFPAKKRSLFLENGGKRRKDHVHKTSIARSIRCKSPLVNYEDVRYATGDIRASFCNPHARDRTSSEKKD